MQKLINFRAFLFIFIGAIFGVIFSLQIIKNNFWCYLIVTIISLLALGYLIFCWFYDKEKKSAFVNKFIICFFIGFILLSLISCLNYVNFTKYDDIENANITARVISVNENNQYAYLILDECKIDDGNRVINLNGRISVVVYSDDSISCEIGDFVSFYGTLISQDLFKDEKISTYAYKNKIKFVSFVDEEQFRSVKGNLHLNEKFRENVKNILFENMNYNTASIAYASIFGDKTLIDNEISDVFLISGVAHLLCVSGLHTGFLIALIYFVLRLFKIKEKYILIILSSILLFYCYLCSFTTSVVRATIMAIVLCSANTFGKRYDSLSSLSFAGLVIMIFKPYMIFDVGFQLSFASCFGIILLSPVFAKMFKKINFYNKFSQAFIITLSAQIATFPIIFHNFEKMSFISVLANVIIVPLFGIVFSALIIFVLINLIFPLGFLLKIIELGFSLIIYLTKSFGAVKTLIFNTNIAPLICSFAFYLIIILCSQLVNVKVKLKFVYVFILTIVISSSYLSQFYPQNFNENYIISMGIDNSTIITNSYNKKVLVDVGEGSESDYINLKENLLSLRIINLDYLILTDYNERMQGTVTKLCNNYHVNKLFVKNDLTSNEEKYLYKNLNNTSLVKVENVAEVANFTIEFFDDLTGVKISVLDEILFSVMFLKDSKDIVTLNSNHSSLSSQYVITNYITSKRLSLFNNFDNIICKNSNIKQNNVFNMSKISGKIIMGEKINYEI